MNVSDEAGLRNFKDFLSIYNQMSEMCFNRCVVNLNGRKLTEEESACTDVCAEKQIVMGVYLVEQPIATERKLKEAEAQAEAAVARLKEQGVDTDSLTPEEVAREAMSLNR